MDNNEEEKLVKMSESFETILGLINNRKPTEAISILSNLLKAIKSGLETANPQYKALYEVKHPFLLFSQKNLILIFSRNCKNKHQF
jgi:hypothetical protein